VVTTGPPTTPAFITSVKIFVGLFNEIGVGHGAPIVGQTCLSDFGRHQMGYGRHDDPGNLAGNWWTAIRQLGGFVSGN